MPPYPELCPHRVCVHLSVCTVSLYLCPCMCAGVCGCVCTLLLPPCTCLCAPVCACLCAQQLCIPEHVPTHPGPCPCVHVCIHLHVLGAAASAPVPCACAGSVSRCLYVPVSMCAHASPRVHHPCTSCAHAPHLGAPFSAPACHRCAASWPAPVPSILALPCPCWASLLGEAQQPPAPYGSA